MKKILILAMSCNQEFFMREEQLVRDTYAKRILDKEFANIDFWTYSASLDDKIHVNKKIHRIEVPCDDTLKGTYQKTIKVFKVLDTLNIEYDYIFRTNCSTYINVRLLEKFVQSLKDGDITIWSGGIYSTKDGSGPYEWCMYGVGNSLLLPKYWVDVLKTLSVNDYKKFDMTPKSNEEKSIYSIDDNAIGFLVNTYALINGMNCLEIWRPFLKSNENEIPKEPYKYIAIPYRVYGGDRELEFKISKLIHEAIESSKVYEDIESLTKNPLVNIINFNKNIRIIVPLKEAIRFICIASDIPFKINKENND